MRVLRGSAAGVRVFLILLAGILISHEQVSRKCVPTYLYLFTNFIYNLKLDLLKKGVDYFLCKI